MQLGRVVGHAVATIKHTSMNGWRLLVTQPLATDGQPDGEPVLAIDNLGAGAGDRIILCNDGAAAQKMVGSKNTPVRWLVLGICDA
jgi:ethanolamine utilization protein EutN